MTGAPQAHSALVTRVTPTAVALGTPLVTHRGGAEAAGSLLAGLSHEAERVGAGHVILEWVGADGPIAPLLQGVLAHAEHPLVQFDRWERAMLRRRPGDDDGYSLRNVGKHRLRTIRQHRRRLDEALGASPVVRNRTDLGAIDAFLRLEASGWKGHEADGLALRQRDGARAFFEAACRQFISVRDACGSTHSNRRGAHRHDLHGARRAKGSSPSAPPTTRTWRSSDPASRSSSTPWKSSSEALSGAGSTRAPHRAIST